MQVFLGVNRLCAAVAPYSSIMRYCATILILSMGVFFWHKGPYQWLNNYKQQIDTDRTHIARLIQAGVQDEHYLQVLHTSCLSLKREMKEFNYLAIKQSADCLVSILDCAQFHGLIVESCSKQYEKEKTWCQKKGFSYTFKGNFVQFFNFFNMLSEQKKLVRCKEFSLEKVGDCLRAHVVFETMIIKDEVYA